MFFVVLWTEDELYNYDSKSSSSGLRFRFKMSSSQFGFRYLHRPGDVFTHVTEKPALWASMSQGYCRSIISTLSPFYMNHLDVEGNWIRQYLVMNDASHATKRKRYQFNRAISRGWGFQKTHARGFMEHFLFCFPTSFFLEV